ncbi:MAG: type II toxin-antitoxin system ParD family antitoxin [Flavobacteriales bacterium]|jgi:hypothetical protein|nr:type II toxin-antitoxin system ParD family antitoxin [Flavobacteriales bacterium]
MKTLNTVSMYALNVDKNDFFERLASLSQENQLIIFNKLSELREEERKEKAFWEAVKLGEESGIVKDFDIDVFFKELRHDTLNK